MRASFSLTLCVHLADWSVDDLGRGPSWRPAVRSNCIRFSLQRRRHLCRVPADCGPGEHFRFLRSGIPLFSTLCTSADSGRQVNGSSSICCACMTALPPRRRPSCRSRLGAEARHWRTPNQSNSLRRTAVHSERHDNLNTSITKPTAATEALELSKRALASRERKTQSSRQQTLSKPAYQPAEQSATGAANVGTSVAGGFPARYKIVLSCMMAFVVCNMVRCTGHHLECQSLWGELLKLYVVTDWSHSYSRNQVAWLNS